MLYWPNIQFKDEPEGYEETDQNNPTTPVKDYPIDDQSSELSDQLPDSLSENLKIWVETKELPENLKTKADGSPLITVFANRNADLKLINEAMTVDSWIDLNGYHIIFGSIDSSESLEAMAYATKNVRILADPLLEPYSQETINIDSEFDIGMKPDQYIGIDEMGVNTGSAASYDGTGVTIAIVDGGVDFGNSDLEPALALDANGLPSSFDTEGYSLIGTPVEISTNVPLTDGNTILAFETPSADWSSATTNDHFGILDYNFWLSVYQFWEPKNWTVDPTWFNRDISQAPAKWGIVWQDIDYGDAATSWSYGYALTLDLYAPWGVYESAVIDMETSAWTTMAFYIMNYEGYSFEDLFVMGLDYLDFVRGWVDPSFPDPDWDFSDNKVVSWIDDTTRGAVATGSDYTFTADWNNDGINDWSYGSMANAYNRDGYLALNQALYGKIINGVDPDGAGFVALHPHGAGFGSHGTWCASMAASRGIVDYPIHNNNEGYFGSWDFPFGNDSFTTPLAGAATEAEILSLAWGASPQDQLLAWFWAAGMDLISTETNITQVELDGSQWVYSGNVRAEITSNSWGDGAWTSGWPETEWLIDLMALPGLGNNTAGSNFYGYPGMLMVTSAGNSGYHQSSGAAAYGTLSLKVGGVQYNHPYSMVYGDNDVYDVLYSQTSGGPKFMGTPNVDVLGPTFVYSAAPLYTADGYNGVPNPGGNGTYAYVFWTGTSASSPAVAGAAANIWQAYRLIKGSEPNPSIIKNIITSTARDISYPSNLQGAGHINASAAVDYINNVGDWFLIQANDTYEAGVDADFRWANFFWIGEFANDPYTNYPAWDYDSNTFFNDFDHADNSVTTGIIEKGDIYTTSVVLDNAPAVQSYALTETLITETSQMFSNINTLLDPFGNYRGYIDLTPYFGAQINAAEYMEITIEGTNEIYYIQLMEWLDKNSDTTPQLGYFDGTSNNGELSRIDRDTPEGPYGMFKVGNPGRFLANDGLVLVFRAYDPSAATNYASEIFTVTVRTYKRGLWSGVSIINAGSGVFDINIDTTNMPVGYNMGWLKFNTSTHEQYTPVIVKVGYGEITGTSASPNTLSFSIDQWTYSAPEEGDMIVIPFAVNESSFDHEGKTLALRATMASPNPSDSLGMRMIWDKIPKYRGGQEIFMFDGDQSGTVSYYQDWGSCGGDDCGFDINGTYQANDDLNSLLWYSHISGPQGIFWYSIIIWANYLESPSKDVTLELYWLDAMPSIDVTWTNDAAQELIGGETITGPNANIHVNADITGDPNLNNWEIWFGEYIERDSIHVEGSFQLPLDTPGWGIDDVVTVDLIADDFVYFYFSVIDAEYNIDDIDLYIFFPPSRAYIGDDSGNADLIFFQPINGDDQSICEGEFIAPETGTYYFGIDSYGTTKDWYGDIQASSFYVNPTGQQYSYSINTHSTWNDSEVTLTSQIVTNTNLFAESKRTFILDNEIAPVVNFTATTWAKDLMTISRANTSITIDWFGSDDNGDALTYYLTFESPNFPPTTSVTATTSFTWDFSDNTLYPDGIYVITVQASDSTEYGGLSNSVSLIITLVTIVDPVTITEIITTVETITESGAVTVTEFITTTETSTEFGGTSTITETDIVTEWSDTTTVTTEVTTTVTGEGETVTITITISYTTTVGGAGGFTSETPGFTLPIILILLSLVAIPIIRRRRR
jgi:hypothetical protein